MVTPKDSVFSFLSRLTFSRFECSSSSQFPLPRGKISPLNYSSQSFRPPLAWATSVGLTRRYLEIFTTHMETTPADPFSFSDLERLKAVFTFPSSLGHFEGRAAVAFSQQVLLWRFSLALPRGRLLLYLSLNEFFPPFWRFLPVFSRPPWTALFLLRVSCRFPHHPRFAASSRRLQGFMLHSSLRLRTARCLVSRVSILR